MVELFAVSFFDSSPDANSRPVLSVARQKLPTSAHVERTFQKKVANPVGGFAAMPLTSFET